MFSPALDALTGASARLAAARSSNLIDADLVGWVCSCNEWWTSAEDAQAVLSDDGTDDTCTACR